MQCLCKFSRQYRVSELTQTFNDHRLNTCSFVFNGEKYHGEGKPLKGMQRTFTLKKYMWTIFTSDNKQLFTFATYDENEPINKRKLRKWMQEFLKNENAG